MQRVVGPFGWLQNKDKTGLSLEEFADAREVVADLSAEYEACEHADYVSAAVA